MTAARRDGDANDARKPRATANVQRKARRPYKQVQPLPVASNTTAFPPATLAAPALTTSTVAAPLPALDAMKAAKSASTTAATAPLAAHASAPLATTAPVAAATAVAPPLKTGDSGVAAAQVAGTFGMHTAAHPHLPHAGLFQFPYALSVPGAMAAYTHGRPMAFVNGANGPQFIPVDVLAQTALHYRAVQAAHAAQVAQAAQVAHAAQVAQARAAHAAHAARLAHAAHAAHAAQMSRAAAAKTGRGGAAHQAGRAAEQTKAEVILGSAGGGDHVTQSTASAPNKGGAEMQGVTTQTSRAEDDDCKDSGSLGDNRDAEVDAAAGSAAEGRANDAVGQGTSSANGCGADTEGAESGSCGFGAEYSSDGLGSGRKKRRREMLERSGCSGEQARENRARALKRLREKKLVRSQATTVRYACRKRIAMVRPRVNGRFATKEEVEEERRRGEMAGEEEGIGEDGVGDALIADEGMGAGKGLEMEG